MNDSLGDRMKSYESQTTSQTLISGLPIIARMDGRAFHTFTRGLQRPYDKGMSNLMIATAQYLLEETDGAITAYTQSDEISLLINQATPDSQVFFGGRVFKMVTALAGMATAFFNKMMYNYIPEKGMEYGEAGKFAFFDARVFNVPSDVEAVNYFLWREQDATKNSISMAAQSMFSHNELMGKNSSDKMEMMWQEGVNWNNYPDFFKRGTYLQRRKVQCSFTAEEIEMLPALHPARLNPTMEFMRQKTFYLKMDPLSKVPDRVEVIFGRDDGSKLVKL